MSGYPSCKQLLRFALVGGTTVAIDYIVYTFLLNLFSPSLSKAISFLCGSFFAYHLNRTWTFKVGVSNTFQVFRFALIYASSVIINVFANGLILSSFSVPNHWRLSIAFLLATAASAIYNFLGMKLFVFA